MHHEDDDDDWGGGSRAINEYPGHNPDNNGGFSNEFFNSIGGKRSFRSAQNGEN